MEVKLDIDLVRDTAAAAIVEAIGKEGRERLVKDAVSYLLTNHRDYRGNVMEKSPIEQAFQGAIMQVAREVISQELAKDSTIREKIRKVVEEAAMRMFDLDRDKLVDGMARAMQSFLSSWRDA